MIELFVVSKFDPFVDHHIALRHFQALRLVFVLFLLFLHHINDDDNRQDEQQRDPQA